MAEDAMAIADSAQTANTTTTAVSMLGHDSDWWNGVMLVSLALAAIAAVAVVVTTAIVITAQKKEARDAKANLERYKIAATAKIAEARQRGVEAGKAAAGADIRAADANKRAAEAHAQAANANNHAAEANERAAAANERAAEARKGAAEAESRAATANERAEVLEKEAATARLEQERLKATLAWRVLSPDEIASLQRELSSHPGTVNLWFTSGDPEAMYLAIQYNQVLERAHWRVLAAGATLPGIVFGIAAPDANGQDALTLRTALRSAGIGFTTDAIPPPTMTVGSTKLQGAPTLMIGSRNPAIFSK